MERSIHTHTPTLSVIDPRGLAVRTVTYWRSELDQLPQTRSELSRYDCAGRSVAQWDPRLAINASAPANLETAYALNSNVLAVRSVDSGWRVNLFAETGRRVWAWDGRGSEQRSEYDDQLRPVAVYEPRCTYRYEYADAGLNFVHHNQCGQLIRNDDAAGTRLYEEYGVAGQCLAMRQHFLQTLDEPDWPLSLNDRNSLLEPVAGALTAFDFNALGELTAQVDARGNRQQFQQTVDGQLREVGLLLKGEVKPKRLVRDIGYDAHGQIERQVSDNGVISQWYYDEHSSRLIRLHAQRSNGEALQDLSYVYDQVGNIISLEDKALPVRFFANQRIEPIRRYIYDSRYQLIEATGWEAGSDNRGPGHREDLTAVATYRQTYVYDTGGNLLELIHHGPQQHGRLLTAAKYSNRCLPEQDGLPPTEAEIAAGFDHNGNLLALHNGPYLRWNVRNQLHQVTSLARESQLNDVEQYVYGADGMRQRKVRSMHTNARLLIHETRYLPGLETRITDGAVLQVITVQAAGVSVQVLHWESPAPRQLANDSYRYTLADHLGSCSLELDSAARVISREVYHPFGTTAFIARGDSSQESYRTLRYSGKEQDVTGLYYYGFRYYVPWLQRWLNPDPAGDIDGLNLYCFLRNSPVVYVDLQGDMIYHFKDSRFSNETPVKGQVVVNFDFPALALSEASKFYLSRSQSGNSFSGVVNLETGQVDIYPLSVTRRDREIRSDWAAEYEGDMHDQGRPIVHSERDADGILRVAHVQLMRKLGEREEQLVGFTLNDLSHLRLDKLEFHEVIQNHDTSMIYGASRSLNTNKMGLIASADNIVDRLGFLDLGRSSRAVSGGAEVGRTNKESFELNKDRVNMFYQLPTEFKRDIASAFIANPSTTPRLRQALERELRARSDMQVLTPPPSPVPERSTSGAGRRRRAVF
ncbi:RHS repeat domain-containing protein [Pseudomonas viridiflava]